MSGPRLDFRILGPLELGSNAGRLHVGGPRQRALLALLLLSANRVVSHDRLLEELFPDQSPEAAMPILRVQVSRLRAVLGPDRLLSRAPGYQLRVEPGELDAELAQRLYDDGRRALAERDPVMAMAALADAEGLWRGRALMDVELDGVGRHEAERLEELRLAVVEERIEAQLALGDHAQIVPELDVLVAEHPLRERLRRQQMLALYRSGRQADALASYRAGRRLLSSELGLEPGPELHDLERAILRQDPELAPPEATAPATPILASPSRRHRRRWPAVLVAAALVGLAAAWLGPLDRKGATPAAVAGDGVALVSPSTTGTPAMVPLGAPPTRLLTAFGSLWASQYGTASVTRIDPTTRTVSQTIHVGTGPFGLAAAGGDVWVTNTLEDTVSRIDPASDEVVGTTRVGAQPGALLAVAGQLWVADRGDGTLVRLDPETGRMVATVHVASGPSDLAAADGSMWVSDETAGTVLRLDERSGALRQTIHVGDAPSELAAANGSLWVLDRLDGTLSRIDTSRDVVAFTTPVGEAPAGVGVLDGAGWVSSADAAALRRVDARTGRVSTRRLAGQGGGPVAAVPGALWVGVTATGRSHRGGTLRVLLPSGDIRSVDPAVQDQISPLELTGLTNDGLVTFDHVEGPDGNRVVADLARSVPAPANGGRSYFFRLRPGIRYSTGAEVRAGDVRRSLERMFEVRSSGRTFYDGIVGAARCERRRRCDLSRGIVTDDRVGTVTFHLRVADPDFLFKLALPYASVLPAATPTRPAHAPLPATGPYLVRAFAPGRGVELVRNPRFREWSAAAQPDGYPDEIDLRTGPSLLRRAPLTAAGQREVMLDIFSMPRALQRLLTTRFPSRLRVNPAPGTDFFFLNTRVPPMNDVRVRQAINLALDRRHNVAIFGGPTRASPTCQILPPTLPGYVPYCPWTIRPGQDGRWRGPDLPRARRLVARSGTRGMTVEVWDTAAPRFAYDEGRSLVSVLRRLGYRASLQLLSDARFFQYTDDSRNRAQIVSGGWSADFPSPSDFIGKLSCAGFIPNSTATFDDSEFCDHRIDRQIARASSLQLTNPTVADALWARLDRELTRRAIWLPTITAKRMDIVARGVGNYQLHPFLGPLVDQLWVR